jgi:hypothetical protein
MADIDHPEAIPEQKMVENPLIKMQEMIKMQEILLFSHLFEAREIVDRFPRMIITVTTSITKIKKPTSRVRKETKRGLIYGQMSKIAPNAKTRWTVFHIGLYLQKDDDKSLVVQYDCHELYRGAKEPIPGDAMDRDE